MHRALECNLKGYNTKSQKKDIAERNVWKKKKDCQCDLALFAHKQKDSWNANSKCYKHMTGNNERSTFRLEHTTVENEYRGKVKMLHKRIGCNYIIENEESHVTNSQRNADEQCTEKIDK